MDIRAFFVTQDREKSTDSVQGAAAQEFTESVINFVHASLPQPSTAMHTYAVPCFFYYDFIFLFYFGEWRCWVVHGSYMGRTRVCASMACVCVCVFLILEKNEMF